MKPKKLDNLFKTIVVLIVLDLIWIGSLAIYFLHK
jgi:hypothetical protein